MVFVDFSNPFLREHYPVWLAAHCEQLQALARAIPSWAAQAGAESDPRPRAITVDIDEVLLCNVHLNAYPATDFYVSDFFTNPEDGSRWGRTDVRDPPLPGAQEFVKAARVASVALFFVTGRLEGIRDITLADLERGGLSSGVGGTLDERLRMLPETPAGSVAPHKAAMRAAIAKKYRVLANIGDQASDLGGHSDRQVLLGNPFYFTL